MQNPLITKKINSIVFVLFCLFSVTGRAQKIDWKNDLELIDSTLRDELPDAERKEFIFKNQEKTFKNSNPVGLAFGGSLFLYQNYFSQHFSASCLFEPTCSDFSKEAVKEFGLIKGTLLSLDRLSRCNRIAATDLHENEMDEHTHRVIDLPEKFK